MGTIPLFSPDSRRLAYVAGIGKNECVVVDGRLGKRYKLIEENTFVFSPDSRRLAYAARSGKKMTVVVNGLEGDHYDSVGTGSLTFSPDSRRIAYGAGIGEEQFVVIDEHAGKKYRDIVAIGGGRIVFDSPNSLHYLTLAGDNIFLIEEFLSEEADIGQFIQGPKQASVAEL